MNTISFIRYGGPEVLRPLERDRPAPGPGQVLVEVIATSINRSDLLAVRGAPAFMRLTGGLFRPKQTIPGSDIAGRVVAVGAGIDRFETGDRVFGDLSIHGRGGFAEYVAVDAAAIALIPGDVDFVDAAAIPTAGVTALQALRDVATLAPAESILIEGASGGVGSFAIQIARALGGRVTAVVGPSHVAEAYALGAERVIDYRASDFTREATRYDVVYAVNGHRTIDEYARILTPRGRFVMTGGTGPLMMRTMLSRSRFAFHMMKPNTADLESLARFVADGTIRPLIDTTYPLTDIPEAMRLLADGHAGGKIVVTVRPDQINRISKQGESV